MTKLKGRVTPVRTLEGYLGVGSFTPPPVVVQPVLQEKTVDPSNVDQVVSPDEGYQGLSAVKVTKVNLQSKTVDPRADTMYVQPDTGYAGLSLVEVTAVALQAKTVEPSGETQTVLADEGYTGLSAVEVAPVSLQSKSVVPSTEDNYVEPDDGYVGLSAVHVSGDVNLVPENIRKGVTVFGVRGTAGSALDENAGVVAGEGRISDVYIDEDTGAFAIVFTNGAMVQGSASFDEFGNPTRLSDTSGNNVEFTDGYPLVATDINGNVVSINW